MDGTRARLGGAFGLLWLALFVLGPERGLEFANRLDVIAVFAVRGRAGEPRLLTNTHR